METEYRVGTLGADDAGAPHRRERIWIVAYSNVPRLQEQQLFHADLPIGPGYAAPEEAGAIARQHPIGQLANTNVCGRLHGQAEEFATSRGFDALGEPEPSGEDVADANTGRRIGTSETQERESDANVAEGREVAGWWRSEPGLGGMVDELAVGMDLHGAIAGEVFPRVASGVEKRADRLKAIGNGQVPAVVALAWTTLYERIQQRSKRSRMNC